MRKRLIANYRKLLFSEEEYDVWESDIEPKLDSMTDEEIRKQYEADKKWYAYRKTMMSV